MTDATMDRSAATAQRTKGLEYRVVWRWHFYAGLFCIPFVLWLSVTGTIFLFHPQIQAWLVRPYDHLAVTGAGAAVNEQVKAALSAIPGAGLEAYQLPADAHSPAEVLVLRGRREYRVYVDPGTAQVLKVDDEDRRVDKFMARLHGELLLGDWGSWAVELAASWAVVMVVTGLFLWWPANGARAGRRAVSTAAPRQADVLARPACGDGDLCVGVCAVSAVHGTALGKGLGRLSEGSAASYGKRGREAGLDHQQYGGESGAG